MPKTREIYSYVCNKKQNVQTQQANVQKINKVLLHLQQKNPLYSRSIYKGFFKNVAKPGFWGCLGITRDDGQRTRDKNDLWKAWKSGKLKFTTLPPFPQATTKGVRFIFKKNIHFLLFTMDEGRRTKDERRETDSPKSRVFIVA